MLFTASDLLAGHYLYKPWAPQQKTSWPGDDEPTADELPKLADLYPFTKVGLKVMDDAIAEQGSGAAVARHLGALASLMNPFGMRTRRTQTVSAGTAR